MSKNNNDGIPVMRSKVPECSDRLWKAMCVILVRLITELQKTETQIGELLAQAEVQFPGTAKVMCSFLAEEMHEDEDILSGLMDLVQNCERKGIVTAGVPIEILYVLELVSPEIANKISNDAEIETLTPATVEHRLESFYTKEKQTDGRP